MICNDPWGYICNIQPYGSGCPPESSGRTGTAETSNMPSGEGGALYRQERENNAV
jgi:hypothetical protein